MNEPILDQLEKLRRFYKTGSTRSYTYRKEQLKKLKSAVLQYEREISEAVYKDLKKSAEEVYATETGLILAEINVMLKNLASWMKPKSSGSDLVNFPSSSKIYRDPLGVVFIIAPWNYPFQLLLLPLAGAIAGGNCVVLKPSELAPATSAVTARMIREIFPPEYILLVEGEGSEVIPAMMNGFRFDHVFFTGSIPVGKQIYQMAAKDLVPVTLELGGKSPAVVEADANIPVAARRIALGKWVNAGQTCIAPDYVLVHEKVKKRLIDELKIAINRFYTNDPLSAYDYGRIINEKRFDKLVSYLHQGELVFGGQHDRAQLYIAPTIMENVSMEAEIMSEEIFGPILPVISYSNPDEAILIIEKNSNPLSFYFFSNNKANEEKWIERVSFGGGCINNTAWHFTNHHIPFGGVGNSGMGVYHGKYSFNNFTRPKPVMKTPVWFDPSLKYPSFKGKLKLFKWIIK